MNQHARFLFEQSERKIPLTYTTSPGIDPTDLGPWASPWDELQYTAELVEDLKRQLDTEVRKAREWRERHERGDKQV